MDHCDNCMRFEAHTAHAFQPSATDMKSGFFEQSLEARKSWKPAAYIWYRNTRNCRCYCCCVNCVAVAAATAGVGGVVYFFLFYFDQYRQDKVQTTKGKQ